ncbi:MAG: hypothetical protein IPM74_04000 [Crocinitomicaceae bacterium]|nr:hypothetical protein [Crocinitomicaceae bacterium]
MKSLLFFLYLFFQLAISAQDCDHYALKTDITNNPSLASAIEANPELIASWKFIREAIPGLNGTTQFALDPKTLNKVAEMMKEGSIFRNKFPSNWSQELATIIGKNNILPCETCGTPSGYTLARYSMVEFLGQVEFFVLHYDITTSGKKFYNWIRRLGADGVTPMNAHGNVEEMYQTLYYIKTNEITNIVDFGKTFPIGTNEYDLFLEVKIC